MSFLEHDVLAGLESPPDPDTYDEAVQLGLEYRTQRDVGGWKLGWLAEKVPTEYGDDTFGKWCDDINIDRGTGGRLRWIASGFPPEIVRQYPRLSMGHYELVRKRMDIEPDAVLIELQEAEDNEMSVRAFRAFLRGETEGEDTGKRQVAFRCQFVEQDTADGRRGVWLVPDGERIWERIDNAGLSGEYIEVVIKLAKVD